METSIVMAWLTGEGLISFRIIKNDHRPPLPGELLGFSGLFVILGLLSNFQPGLAALTAWGVDIAAFMNLAPGLTGPTAPAKTAATPSTATANGAVTTKG